MKYLDINFPTEFKHCFTKQIEFSTSSACLKNKQSFYHPNWQYPRYKFILSHKICNYKSFQKLNAFFLICKGRGTAFNFLDITDNTIQQQISIGDGITNAFDIYKTYSIDGYTHKRKINNIKNAKIYIDNHLVKSSSYTISNGTLSFTADSIPANNSVITMMAEFYIIARFDIDKLQYTDKVNSIELQDLSIIETQI